VHVKDQVEEVQREDICLWLLKTHSISV